MSAHLSCHVCQLAVQVSALEHSTHLVADWQRQGADAHAPRTVSGGVQQRTLQVHLWLQAGRTAGQAVQQSTPQQSETAHKVQARPQIQSGSYSLSSIQHDTNLL
jgi:hypothetical protein